jgi:hypothetical protein
MQRGYAARIVAPGRAIEAGIGDHRRETGLIREFGYRFHEIAVGLSVACHRLADARYGVEGPRLVDAVQQRHLDLREFETQEASARLQDPKGLRQRNVDARHVADAESDRIGVEARIREGQFLGIGFDESHIRLEPALRRALAADRQHRSVDVEYRRVRGASRGLDDAERDVAGTAGHVQHTPPGAPRRVEPRHHGVLPDAMEPCRHEVVHQIVAAGDAMEHIVDQPLLLVRPDLPVAVGGFHVP